MKKNLLFLLLLFSINTTKVVAQNLPISLRINPYSDSVKIVDKLSYFVNVEALWNNTEGDKIPRIMPVAPNLVTLTTTFGKVDELSLFFDKTTPPDSFIVNVVWNKNKNITTSKTLYVQKFNRDAIIQKENIAIDSATTAPVFPVKKKKKRTWKI